MEEAISNAASVAVVELACLTACNDAIVDDSVNRSMGPGITRDNYKS